MKILSAFLLTFMFILTGCGNTGSGGDTHVDTSKYLRVSTAANSNNSPVGIEQYATLTFSAAIDEATVSASSVYIADENNVPIASVLTVSEKKISIIPNEFFLPNKQYTIIVTTAVEDREGRTLENTFTHTFTTASAPDNIPPSLISLTPAEGTSADKATDIVMAFDETIANNGAVLEVRDSINNTIVNGTSAISENIMRFVPESDLIPGASYTVTLVGTVEDLAGNAYIGQTSWDFSVNPLVDTTPPSLISLTPAEGTSADKATDIVMAFDETIANNGAVLEVRDSINNTIVNGTSAISENTLRFIPESDLIPGASYTVTLVGTVEDLAGNAYTGQTSWDFSVNPLVDTTPPSLISLTPAEGTSADKATDIVMAFDETIANNGAVLEVRDSINNTIVNGTSAISDNTLCFIPESDLIPGASYTVTLVGTVEDLTGNIYTGQTSWNFSVIAVSDLSVVSVSHSGRVIRVAFSEHLDPSTVSEDDFAIFSFYGGLITFDHLIMEDESTVKFIADSKIYGSEKISVSGTIKDIYGNSHNNGVTAIYDLGK